MKNTIISLTVAVLSACSLNAQLSFDQKEYSKAWETSQSGAIMKEYLTENETTESWSTMITLQAHPNAKEVKEVSGPYYEARKSIVALPPQLHPKREEDFTDAILELFLGAPGVTPHLEFVLARFVQTDQGVYAMIYSHKIPLKSKKKNQNVDVDHIMSSKEEWIKELLNIPVESITNEF